MFTVFIVDGCPGYIKIVNTDHFEKALKDRNIDLNDVRSQELSLEQLVRLKDREYKVFTLCLK